SVDWIFLLELSSPENRASIRASIATHFSSLRALSISRCLCHASNVAKRWLVVCAECSNPTTRARRSFSVSGILFSISPSNPAFFHFHHCLRHAQPLPDPLW